MEKNSATTIEDTLLSFDALHDSYEELVRALHGRSRLPPARTAQVPWPMALICRDLDAPVNRDLALTAPPLIVTQLSYNRYANFDFSEAFYRLFLDSIARAGVRGVEVIIVLPPMSQYELESLRLSGEWPAFMNFKRRLAAIQPFWDFSGYNPVARSDQLFSDVIHTRAGVGQLILRVALGKDTSPCGERARAVIESGVRVDRSNIEDVIASQQRMEQLAARDGSRYSRAAAEAMVIR
ncbi:MAG TPA: hypothetical protein VEF07_00170 [Candidatus Binataceae bacterium]|nr:hypothetical protein [Candidatus Binataceae bacterium]